MTAPIAFCDTETDGVHPTRRPWEIAVIRREPDGTRREYHAFVGIDLSTADPFALNVGGFYTRHPFGRWLSGEVDHLSEPGCLLAGTALSGAILATAEEVIADPCDPRDEGYRALYLTPEQAALAWCRWTHGAHVIGAVPSFDTEVMAAASRAAGVIPAHHYHLADAENLITGWLRGYITAAEQLDLPDDERAKLDRWRAACVPPWSSDALFAAMGIVVPDEERHTALGDARAVERAWDAVMGTAA